MDYVLEAYKRVKGEKASSLRSNGWVPGCVYGKSMEPLNLKIKTTDLQKCLKHHAAKFKGGGRKRFSRWARRSSKRATSR